jgi:cell division protein FtsL
MRDTPESGGSDFVRGDRVLESYMVVLFGAVIVVQQFIMYLMYVRIRQLLTEINAIEGKMKITDTEIDSLIQKVEEFKRSSL